MTQQTAVDWLVNKIYMVIPNEERNFLEGLREQAKQMEKEQIQNAWHDGNFLGRNGNLFVDYNTKEGYYKYEFGNK
jgi:hypothetical protein